jgi:hypothetical protein
VNPYQSLFASFAEEGIRYLVVGGVAVNLHGVPRFTGDLDVVLALDDENLARMTALMEKRGYEHRLPVDLAEFSQEKTVRRYLKEKNLIAYTFQSGKEPQMDIDVLVGESLGFAALDRRKTIVPVWDIEVPVISLDDLIDMKRRANRSQDVQDVQALLELKGL